MVLTDREHALVLTALDVHCASLKRSIAKVGLGDDVAALYRRYLDEAYGLRVRLDAEHLKTVKPSKGG